MEKTATQIRDAKVKALTRSENKVFKPYLPYLKDVKVFEVSRRFVKSDISQKPL
jgi:hypothetical protein